MTELSGASRLPPMDHAQRNLEPQNPIDEPIRGDEGGEMENRIPDDVADRLRRALDQLHENEGAEQAERLTPEQMDQIRDALEGLGDQMHEGDHMQRLEPAQPVPAPTDPCHCLCPPSAAGGIGGTVGVGRRPRY